MNEKLTSQDLSALPRTAIVIRRRAFRLTVYSRINTGREFVKLFSVPVSIGQLGHETPPGQCMVLDKEMPPTYTAPDEQWARDLGYRPGERLPTDHPSNPLRGAWLRLTDDGIGIHGSDSWPLGQKASHGCIRVRPKDAIALYEAVAVGSPVTIV